MNNKTKITKYVLMNNRNLCSIIMYDSIKEAWCLANNLCVTPCIDFSSNSIARRKQIRKLKTYGFNVTKITI